MPRAVDEWDEAYILSLPKENDEFEKKSSLKLDVTLPGVDENEVLNELAKQLSAFANSGGGKIIYGVKNDGTSDGGVSTTMKSGGTKEWLERQLSVVTEYEIIGANVFEIEPASSDSQIHTGKAFYVVDVPDSDRAPHQSRRDSRYYVRLNSQSQPASHRMIEDVRNRLKHPRVYPKFEMDGLEHRHLGGRAYEINMVLRIIIINEGPLKSNDTFLLLTPIEGNIDADRPGGVESVPGSRRGSHQWSLTRVLPPQSDLSFRVRFSVVANVDLQRELGVVWSYQGGLLDDLAIEWTVFADSAPPKNGTLRMGSLNLTRQLYQMVR